VVPNFAFTYLNLSERIMGPLAVVLCIFIALDNLSMDLNPQNFGPLLSTLALDHRGRLGNKSKNTCQCSAVFCYFPPHRSVYFLSNLFSDALHLYFYLNVKDHKLTFRMSHILIFVFR
jgi:hypothetical protein